MFKIKFIRTNKIETIIPLLLELNKKIDKRTLKSRLKEMVKMKYKCIGIFKGKSLIGVSGLWVLNKYYIGRHVEMDNVYIKYEYRNNGLGKMLIEWVDKYAIKMKCNGAELNCYIDNINGHRFWEKCGYKKLAIHFQKIY